MMRYLCVLVFICGIYGCLGEDGGYRNDRRRDDNRERLNQYRVLGSDNNEGKENIWRPCSLKNYECMEEFLASNSKCIPRRAYAPDPIELPIEKFYSPVAGLTITHLDAKIRGFKDARVTEFYVNKATGNVVIAVTIPTYNFTSSSSYFTFQRTAKEPVALKGYNTFEQDRVILTATIPKVHNLNFDLVEVHANLPSYPPRYYVGPEAYTSQDSEVIKEFKKFKGNVVQVLKEAFILHSYYLMTLFIQKELCDFGIDSFESYNGYLSFHRGVKRD